MKYSNYPYELKIIFMGNREILKSPTYSSGSELNYNNKLLLRYTMRYPCGTGRKIL